MEKFDIYSDIAERTNGDIYIGVVGPVRTGKSTFVTKFMENFVIPNISEKLQKQIATDEMPQSADGKTIMTTQPKFVPANAVKVEFQNKATASVRLIDSVGYFVKGANGAEEDEKPRLVKTPWSDKELPFEEVAELGTKKIIDDYSTIGVLVTTDGSFSDISRLDYEKAEEKVVDELKTHGKPFVIVLNVKNPESKSALSLADSLETKYGVSVICVNVLNINANDITNVMAKALMEFPMNSFNVNLPKWMQALPCDHPIINGVITCLKENAKNIEKMRDYSVLNKAFCDNEDFCDLEIEELKLGEGKLIYNLPAKENLYYKVLSSECGENIENDYELLNYIKTFSCEKKKYEKMKTAIKEAEENGYGIVMPTIAEMNLEDPELVKKSGKYGVKLRASAPSLHIMKVDVKAEVSPMVGTEKQGEDLVKSIMDKYEDNPSGIWETNIFGKSLYELVDEGMQSKINAMPKDTQGKMRKTVTRIVNENRGGVICILL